MDVEVRLERSVSKIDGTMAKEPNKSQPTKSRAVLFEVDFLAKKFQVACKKADAMIAANTHAVITCTESCKELVSEKYFGDTQKTYPRSIYVIGDFDQRLCF